MELGCNSDRNRAGENPLSIHGIMFFLVVFLFLESPLVLIASSNDKDTAASDTNRSNFSLSAEGGGTFDKEAAEYSGVTIKIGEAVITADYAKVFFKKSAGGGLSFTVDSIENIEDSFEKIVVRDNVKIVYEGLIATGDKAVYESAVGSFVLTGDPATLINSAGTISSTEITAGRIVLNEAAASADFIGNVIITRGGTVITADNVEAIFKKSAEGEFSPNEDSFEKIVVRDNVKIVYEGLIATGDKAVYESAVGSFVLSGDPATLIGAGTISSTEITAGRIVLNEAAASADFIGNVIITRGGTVITADNVEAIFKKSAEDEFSLNEDSFGKIVVWDNVKIVYEGLIATGDKAVYESAVGSFVLSGDPATLINSAGTTSSSEIRADRIVLDEAEASAEFTGNVNFTQGETFITADNLKAFLKKGADGSFSRNEDSVKKILAGGSVKIVVEDKVATGDEAVYDSAAGKFVLTGDPATFVVGVYTASAPRVEIIREL